jgi:hypothetical protein
MALVLSSRRISFAIVLQRAMNLVPHIKQRPAGQMSEAHEH